MDRHSKHEAANGRFASKHGMTKHRWYSIWVSMMARCYNEKNRTYPGYGGRGICVCDAWKSPGPFLMWLENAGYRNGLQIDRIDNDGDYSPSNCRVVSRSENCRNRRDNRRYLVRGEMLLACEVQERYGIKEATFRARVERYGKTPEQALVNRRNPPTQRAALSPVGG